MKLLPKRRDSRKETAQRSEEDEESSGPGPSNPPESQNKEEEDPEKDVSEHVTEVVEDVPMTDDERKEVIQLRSVLFANIGACHVKLVCCIRRFCDTHAHDVERESTKKL